MGGWTEEPLGPGIRHSLPSTLHPMQGRYLYKVLPVLEHKYIDDLEITLISIEVYDDGSILTYRICRAPEKQSLWSKASFRNPGMLRFSITDGSGTEYVATTTSARHQTNMTRAEVGITPAIPADAQELNIEAFLEPIYGKNSAKGAPEARVLYSVRL